MASRYIALDPISGAVVAVAETKQQAIRQVEQLESQPVFASVAVPIYLADIIKGKASNLVRVAEVRA